MDNHLTLFRRIDKDKVGLITMADCEPALVQKIFAYGTSMLVGTLKKKTRKEKVSFLSPFFCSTNNY
jgi:hypothetical protein